MRKYSVKINPNIGVSEVNEIHVFRATPYKLVDKNNNLLYKIKSKCIIQNKYLIIDSNDIKQGELIRVWQS